MKTAVSVPDDVYERAEREVARSGRTRSAVYAAALRAYLDEIDERASAITARLDEVYADDTQDAGRGVALGRQLVDDGAWDW